MLDTTIGRPPARYQNSMYDSARWEGFRFRPGDIVISTPPKCGTTWTQMIVALVIFRTPELPAPLAQLSPWLDQRTRARRDVVASLEAQTHRRFIKTHTPLPGLPIADGVTFISVGRDPRDVRLSHADHRANLDFATVAARLRSAAEIDGVETPVLSPPQPAPEGETEHDRFWRWALDDRDPMVEMYSLRAMLDHVQSFWNARDALDVVMLHYHDLTEDLEREMRRLAGRLGIDVPDDRWPALVAAASFDEMRAKAPMTAPNADGGMWRDTAAFFRKGRRGEWRELLTDGDIRRYGERVAELAPADFAAWMHRS